MTIQGPLSRVCFAALLAGLLGACSAGITLAELEASYQTALERSHGRAFAGFADDPDRLADAVAGVEAFFRDASPESVREQARALYAQDAYLNDTLAAIEGVDAIEAYFIDAVSGDRALQVTFLGTAVQDIDVYVRWRMAMTVPSLNRGEPIVSHGVTQFRFDADHRVLLHKDFWDSGSGLYEHVPVLGRIIRRLRPSHGT